MVNSPSLWNSTGNVNIYNYDSRVELPVPVVGPSLGMSHWNDDPLDVVEGRRVFGLPEYIFKEISKRRKPVDMWVQG